MPCKNPCRLYIPLAFTYSIGPSSLVRSELGPAPPFPPMRVIEVYWSRALNLVSEVALRDWEPVTIILQTLSLVGKAEPVQVRFTLRSRDQRSLWMQEGCKVYMDTYMASNGSCFIVIWTIFKNHLVEVGRTQIWDTMALRTLTTVGLFYFDVWGPAWIDIH
jgi:hypothetical protein